MTEHDRDLYRYLEEERRREREEDRFRLTDERFRRIEDRVTKLETAFEIESRDFTDTKRFRLTQAGVPMSIPPRRSDSIVPKAVREVLRHKVTFILLGLWEVGRRLVDFLLQHAK